DNLTRSGAGGPWRLQGRCCPRSHHRVACESGRLSVELLAERGLDRWEPANSVASLVTDCGRRMVKLAECAALTSRPRSECLDRLPVRRQQEAVRCIPTLRKRRSGPVAQGATTTAAASWPRGAERRGQRDSMGS